MDGEGKVERRTVGGQRADLTLRRKNEYLAGKEIQFDGVEEIHRVGLRVVEYLLDGTQPFVQLVFVLSVFLFHAVFIFPVGGKSLLGYLIHAVRAYLNLYPSALFRHQCHVECLIAIGLRMREPVAQTVGVRLVNLRNRHVYLEAFVDLFLAVVGGEDDAHGQDIIDLLEAYVLVLHLVPDGVGALDAFLYLVFDAHSFKGCFDRRGKLCKQLVTRYTGRLQF